MGESDVKSRLPRHRRGCPRPWRSAGSAGPSTRRAPRCRGDRSGSRAGAGSPACSGAATRRSASESSQTRARTTLVSVASRYPAKPRIVYVLVRRAPRVGCAHLVGARAPGRRESLPRPRPRRRSGIIAGQRLRMYCARGQAARLRGRGPPRAGAPVMGTSRQLVGGAVGLGSAIRRGIGRLV